MGSLTGAVASSVGRPGGNARGKSGYMLGSPSPSPEAPPAPDEEGEGFGASQCNATENATDAGNQQGSQRDPSTTVRQTSGTSDDDTV